MLIDRFFWAMCSDCLRVVYDTGLLLQTTKSHPCPHCGAVGGHVSWPGFGLGDFSIIDPRVEEPRAKPPEVLPDGSTVIEIPMETPEDISIACVFLSAALEAILQNSLRQTVERYGTNPRVLDALMARSRQREGLLRLYGDLVGRSAKAVLQAHDGKLGKWFDDWKVVVDARNLIGHGARRSLPKPAVVRSVREHAFAALSTLHNAAMDAADGVTPTA